MKSQKALPVPPVRFLSAVNRDWNVALIASLYFCHFVFAIVTVNNSDCNRMAEYQSVAIYRHISCMTTSVTLFLPGMTELPIKSHGQE